jgi:hypothetical protein
MAGNVELDGQGVINVGERSREFDIHDGADDLDDFAFIHGKLRFSALKERKVYGNLAAVSRGRLWGIRGKGWEGW